MYSEAQGGALFFLQRTLPNYIWQAPQNLDPSLIIGKKRMLTVHSSLIAFLPTSSLLNVITPIHVFLPYYVTIGNSVSACKLYINGIILRYT